MASELDYHYYIVSRQNCHGILRVSFTSIHKIILSGGGGTENGLTMKYAFLIFPDQGERRREHQVSDFNAQKDKFFEMFKMRVITIFREGSVCRKRAHLFVSNSVA